MIALFDQLLTMTGYSCVDIHLKSRALARAVWASHRVALDCTARRAAVAAPGTPASCLKVAAEGTGGLAAERRAARAPRREGSLRSLDGLLIKKNTLNVSFLCSTH